MSEPTTSKITPMSTQTAQPKRETAVVTDVIPVLDSARFEHMYRIAQQMSRSSLVPGALRHSDPQVAAANCFLIVNQAVRWGMDPFALMQHAYVVAGKLGYEGKVIAALVNASGNVGRLEYTYGGPPGEAQRSVTVSGTFADTGKTVEISGTVAGWSVKTNEKWTSIPDQMLAYRGAREWARRYMPELMLGIYSDDELEDMRDMGALRAGQNGVFRPDPTGDRPTDAAIAPRPTEMFPLYDSDGALVDAIGNADAYGKLLLAAIEDTPRAVYDALMESNADGIGRLDRKTAEALVDYVPIDERAKEEREKAAPSATKPPAPTPPDQSPPAPSARRDGAVASPSGPSPAAPAVPKTGTPKAPPPKPFAITDLPEDERAYFTRQKDRFARMPAASQLLAAWRYERKNTLPGMSHALGVALEAIYNERVKALV